MVDSSFISPLSGEWCGFSRPKAKSGSLTLWKDVIIESKDSRKGASVYHASGRGASHWRGHVIPFNLSISCNLVSSYLTLDKMHCGREYTNSNRYSDCQFGYCEPKALHNFLSSESCFVDGYSPGMASNRPPNVIVKWSGSQSGVVKLVRLSPPPSSSSLSSPSSSVPVEAGDESSKERGDVDERHMWSSWLAVHLNVGPHAQAQAQESSSSAGTESVDGIKAPAVGYDASASVPPTTQVDLNVQAMSPPPVPPSTRVPAAQAQICHDLSRAAFPARTPRAHGFDAQAPQSASSTTMSQPRPPGGPSEADICKLCYSAVIDAVILPCGHFAVCYDCGTNLDVCPFDRLHITKLQPIYRV